MKKELTAKKEVYIHNQMQDKEKDSKELSL